VQVIGEILLVVLVGVLGGVSGALRGGQIEGLTQATLQLTPALLAGLVLQGVAVVAAGLGWSGWPIVLASVLGMVALLAFVVANQRLPGMVLVGLGLVGNLLVVGLNGGMPVTDATLERAGRPVTADSTPPERPDALHVRADSGSRLRMLSDVLAIRPLRTVSSIGDVAQYAGLFLLVQGLMLKGAQAQRPRYELFDYRVRGGT
jgi:hypothetical protein